MSAQSEPGAQGRALDLAQALLIGILAFAVHYLAHKDFNDDHFIHLAKSQAWLAGDWPIRDFTEFGAPLTLGLSAGAQLLLGQNLLAELLLSVAGLAVGAAATSWVTTRLTGRAWLGALAGLWQVAVSPRLFAYPKLLVYPVELMLCLRYLHRPTRGRLAALAGWVATAFLIRHDHGAYAAVGACVAVVSTHAHEGLAAMARRAGELVLLVLACLAPFLIYVQAQTGVVEHFRLGLEATGTEAQRSGLTGASVPVFALAPGPWVAPRAPDVDRFPRIRVRWSASLNDTDRLALERRGHLRDAEPTDDRTWAYRADPDHFDALRSVFGHPAVEDVSGIDRRTMRLDEWGPALRTALRRVMPDRLPLGPRTLSALSYENLAVLLFYLCWATPLAAMLVWLLARPVPAASGWLQDPSRLIPALCVLTLVCTVGLLRGDPLRLPDIFGTFPILMCWMIAELVSVRARGARTVLAGVALIFIAVVTLSVREVGDRALESFVQDALDPPAAVAKAVDTTRSTYHWPWVDQWPGNEEWRLARYIHDCTRADDRLLVTFAGPQFFVFSGRAFAGGEGALFPLLRRPSAYEQQVLETWKRQHVPIVLTRAASQAEFAATFPALAAYLSEAYANVATPAWDDSPAISVHVDRRRVATGRDAELGLPCFADVVPGSARRPA